jgi:hypothetical protein
MGRIRRLAKGRWTSLLKPVGGVSQGGTSSERCIDNALRQHDDFSQGVIMIKKAAGGYRVLSEKGKNLGGPYKTKKEAEKRLKQVEYFKHHK